MKVKFLRTLGICVCLLLMIFSFQGTASAIGTNVGGGVVDKNPLGGFYQRGVFACESSASTFSADFRLELDSNIGPLAPTSGFDYADSELWVNGRLQWRVDPGAASRMIPPRIPEKALSGYFDHLGYVGDSFRRGYVYTKYQPDSPVVALLRGHVLTDDFGFLRYRNNKGDFGIQVVCPQNRDRKRKPINLPNTNYVPEAPTNLSPIMRPIPAIP